MSSDTEEKNEGMERKDPPNTYTYKIIHREADIQHNHTKTNKIMTHTLHDFMPICPLSALLYFLCMCMCMYVHTVNSSVLLIIRVLTVQNCTEGDLFRSFMRGFMVIDMFKGKYINVLK